MAEAKMRFVQSTDLSDKVLRIVEYPDTDEIYVTTLQAIAAIRISKKEFYSIISIVEQPHNFDTGVST